MPDSPAQAAYNYFIARGYDAADAAAIVGNIGVESNFNFHAKGDYINGKPTAFGLAQWRNERVEQFEKLFNKPITESNFSEQLGFIDWELKNTHTNAYYRMTDANNIGDKTFAIMKLYEIPKDNSSLGSRISIANNVLSGNSVISKAQEFMQKALKTIGFTNPLILGPTIGAAIGYQTEQTAEDAVTGIVAWIPRIAVIIIGFILIIIAISALLLKSDIMPLNITKGLTK